MRHIFNRPLILSALLALLGGRAAFVALTDARRAAAPGDAPVPVVAAARAIAVGQQITAADLVIREVPPDAVSPDGARTIAEVEGRYASLPLIKGELVLRPKLNERPPGSNLASLIPPGRVAVSVAVSDVVSTGGFIAPGDRVNVLGVTSREAGDAAEVVLRDVVVLAVANTVLGAREAPAATKATARDNPRSLDGTVTLAVTVEEARRLVQVDETGKVRLALLPREAIPATASAGPR